MATGKCYLITPQIVKFWHLCLALAPSKRRQEFICLKSWKPMPEPQAGSRLVVLTAPTYQGVPSITVQIPSEIRQKHKEQWWHDVRILNADKVRVFLSISRRYTSAPGSVGAHMHRQHSHSDIWGRQSRCFQGAVSILVGLRSSSMLPSTIIEVISSRKEGKEEQEVRATWSCTETERSTSWKA